MSENIYHKKAEVEYAKLRKVSVTELSETEIMIMDLLTRVETLEQANKEDEEEKQ